MRKIILFYGEECPDCTRVMPWLDQLGVEIEKYEVWHNDENRKLREEYKELIETGCSSYDRVPSFIDVEKKRSICEPRTIEELKEWLNS